VEPILLSVAGAALTEGVKFLYAQASEVLRAWRERRRAEATATPAAPAVLPVPKGIELGPVDPLPVPADSGMEDTLADLRDLAEQVKDGTIDPTSERGRQIVANLRDLLEVVLRAPITFEGEAPREFTADSVTVVTRRVEGEVVGLRAAAGVTGRVGDVSVRTDDVAAGGRVTGAEFG
jgi:hypothetical protein